jgi:protein O-GlcNAc transferase
LVLKAFLLVRSGDHTGAEGTYRRAIKTDPHCADAWAHLGCLMLDAHRDSEALDCFEHVLNHSPGPGANRVQSQAASLLAEIVAARPDWATGQFSLGYAYQQLREYPFARTHLQNASRLDPALTAAVESLLSNMDWNAGNFTSGLAAADRAIQANPDYCYAHIARADCCSGLIRIAEACESRRRAIELQPHPLLHSNLLFDMNFLAATTPEAMYAEACRWNSLYAAPLAVKIRPHDNTPDPERRIKVGYVSPDFHNHAIMRFFPPVIEHCDRSRFEVFVYAVGSRTDEVTEQFRRGIENYISMPALGSEIAERVRTDGIDILIDLAGHTTGTAYLGFALKPAPVQVSWLGVLSTTGLSTMDYFLGDAQLPCDGIEHLFSETVVRLPVVCCYRPFADVPVAPAPSRERGYLTFGSFNNPRKITREVVQLWSAILHLAPGSRLLLKYGTLEIEEVQNRFRQWFTEDGISPERITLAGASPQVEYLGAFGEIDVALDPFPYNGGSTTLDTLWMGVPVVTLAGRLAVQRAGASILAAIGMQDLIAQTPEQYVNAALFLAESAQKIPDLRQNVRQALRSSPLMDEIGFVRSLEKAYRNMWRAWCRQTENNDPQKSGCSSPSL